MKVNLVELAADAGMSKQEIIDAITEAYASIKCAEIRRECSDVSIDNVNFHDKRMVIVATVEKLNPTVN